MKPIPTIVLVLILARVAPIYEEIEHIFGFSSNYYYVWTWSLATNLSGIAWATVVYRLISPRKIWVRAVVMAYTWGVFFDSLGMTNVDLERYDSLHWELLCMAWGLLFAALISVPIKHKEIQRQERLIEEENEKIIEWFIE